MDGTAASEAIIENCTFDEITVGDTASLPKTVTQQDTDLLAVVFSDVNPAHIDPAYAETTCSTASSPTTCSAPG